MRRFLGLLLSLSFSLALAGPMGADDARHLLGRTAFWATPAQVAEFAALSREEAVDRLLTKVGGEPATPPPAELLQYLPPGQMREESQEERQAMQKEFQRKRLAMRAWWLNEMLTAELPATALRERMTLFWHNHFVSSDQKVRSSKLMLEQNLLLRREALGNFGRLLRAIGRDPAMVLYLDSASNRKGQPNENFAREVMELFTLGEGHYSEADIKEAARAFTGWSFERESGSFRWRPAVHDQDFKTVLGRRGNFDGDAVIDILLARPETGQFVSGKLWREFVSPLPNPGQLAQVAAAFRDSGYEVRAALRALLLAPAFWAPENRAALIKSPVDLVVGTWRAAAMPMTDLRPAVVALRQMGQDLFAPPNVRGWPGGTVWINTDSLLVRKQFLDRLARSMQLGSDIDRDLLMTPAYQLK